MRVAEGAAGGRFDRDAMAEAVCRLAGRGVYLGTSSWKYPGWFGLLYEEGRYHYRGKVAKTRFERGCLEEYAEVFRSVCVDAGFYRFPSPRFVDGIMGQVPDDFRFSFKVTGDITIRKFPRLPQHGHKGGKLNPLFLDAEVFRDAFLTPLLPHRAKVGALLFSFSRFHPGDFEGGREFVERLDAFLTAAPAGWQYAVEIRNPNLFRQEYFEVLARHGVAHVYSSWSGMPPVAEQWAAGASRTADFLAARFLLKPGRGYKEAVDLFSPYDRVGEEQPEVRAAGAEMLSVLAREGSPRPSLIYVNNRLEGNALFTIAAMLAEAGLG